MRRNRRYYPRVGWTKLKKQFDYRYARWPWFREKIHEMMKLRKELGRKV